MASQSRLDPARHDLGVNQSAFSLRLLDPKFLDNASSYAYQCFIAALAIFVVLCLLDTLTQTVLIAALGASSFIAFTMPHANAAKPRYLIGGDAMGAVVGCGVSLLGTAVIDLSPPALQHLLLIAFAAMATGCAIFIMTITDTEHPPAAGLALGFVLNEWDFITVAVVIIGIICISALKETFRTRLKDLL